MQAIENKTELVKVDPKQEEYEKLMQQSRQYNEQHMTRKAIRKHYGLAKQPWEDYDWNKIDLKRMKHALSCE